MIKGLLIAVMSSFLLPLGFTGNTFGDTSDKNAGTLNVEIKNIKSKKGKIRIEVFDEKEDFLKNGKVIPVRISKTGSISVDLDDLTFGKYAISIYHDLNNNGKLDTNFFGIPEEPYGFSNNIRPRFRAPRYDESEFAFSREGQSIEIKLGSAF